MHACLYILELVNGQYYIGSTPDLHRRLLDHQSGKVISTKGKLPFELAFHQEFESLPEARRTEYKLKSYKNKNIIKQIISDQKIKSREQSK